MDSTSKPPCPKCQNANVYRVTHPLIEGTDIPRVTAWKEGKQTWNCAACWHQWPVSGLDEQLSPSI
jgi:hypothetical protein